MRRPPDSRDLRLVARRIAITSLDRQSETLCITSEIELDHFDQHIIDCPIEASARRFPFTCSTEEIPDLHRSIEHDYPDLGHLVGTEERPSRSP